MSTLVGKSINNLEDLATDVQAALTTIDTLSQILSGSTEKVEGMQTMLKQFKTWSYRTIQWSVKN